MNDIEKAIEGLKGLNERSSKESELFKERHGRSFDLAISALEKQMPKKVFSPLTFGSIAICPSCYASQFNERNYCYNCGQKIDWEAE